MEESKSSPGVDRGPKEPETLEEMIKQDKELTRMILDLAKYKFHPSVLCAACLNLAYASMNDDHPIKILLSDFCKSQTEEDYSCPEKILQH